MKYFRSVLLIIGIAFTAAGYAQQKVVVIPLLDKEVIFTGIGSTGDTKCSEFNNPPGSWQEVNCASLEPALKGQDGDLQEGAVATPRYAINGDGTVTDRLTGLVWLQEAFCAGTELGNTWSDALSFVVELNTLGSMDGNDCSDSSNGGTHQSDWRLPNIKELQSLVYYEHDMGVAAFPFISDSNGNGPYSSGDPFLNVKINKAYWTSTNYGFVFDADPDVNTNLIDDALRVNFADAVMDGSSKNGLQHVWAVRAGD